MENKNLISPKMPKALVYPDARTKAEYLDILSSMVHEQSEHLHNRFNEAYLKYREVVIAWMVDVCDYFSLHITTSHMALAYLDRIQPHEKFTRFEWQILAIACIIIAAKYNEMEEHVPPLKKIEEITQQAIPNDTFLYYELWVLKRMGWKLNARVPSAFLTAQFELGLLDSEKDFITSKSSSSTTPKKKLFSKANPDFKNEMKEKMLEISTKCMIDTKFKGLQASSIATAIILYVRKIFQVSPTWTDDLTYLTFHDPRTSKSTNAAFALIIEMENRDKENQYILNSSHSEDITEDVDHEAADENDVEQFDDDEADPLDEENADLVQALQRALFIDEKTTPIKSSQVVHPHQKGSSILKMITPTLKGSQHIPEMISPVGVEGMN